MRYLDAKSTQYCWQLVVIYICNKSTNKDTSQHASTNNIRGIHYNNLRPQMGASLCVLLHTQGTLGRSPLSLPINEFLFTSFGSWRGWSPNTKSLCSPDCYLYSWSPPPEAKVGSAAVPCNSLTLFTPARVSGNRPGTSKHCLGDDTREDRNRQAIKCITRLSNVQTLNDPKGEQKADTIHRIATKLKFI